MSHPTVAGGRKTFSREQQIGDTTNRSSVHAVRPAPDQASAALSYDYQFHPSPIAGGATGPAIEPFVEAEEAAAFLHYCPRHLKRLAREHKVPAHPKGDGQRRRWLFKLSELDAWMMGRVNSPCDPCREPRRIH